MYPKNSATPPILTVGSIYLIADGTIQTSGASVRVKTGAGAWGAGGNSPAYDTTSGVITYTPTQAETNDEEFQVAVYKAGCTTASITVITSATSVAGTVDVGAISGDSTAADNLEALTEVSDQINGLSVLGQNYWDNGYADANSVAISGDSTAANNLELALENATAGYIAADVTHLSGDTQSLADLKDFADAGYDPATNKVQGVVLVDTTTTNTDMVSEPPTAAAIVDEWETQSQADPTGFHVNVYEIKDQLMAASNPITVNAVVGAPTQTATALAVVALQNDMDLVPKSTGTESWNATALAALQSEANDALVAWGKTGFSLAAGGMDSVTLPADIITAASIANAAIDAATFAADVDAEILSYIVDDATQIDASALNTASGLAAGATGFAAIDTVVDAVKVVTDAQAADGSGLSAIPWNSAWDAEVQSEVDDALDTAIAELGVGAPTATPTMRTGLMLLYMAMRNKLVVQTSGTDALEIYNNAGTKIAKKLLGDDGSDYTEDQATSG